MNRCNFIASHLFYEILIKQADVIIEPNIKQISWSEFNKFNLMVNEGKKAAESKIAEIKNKLKKYNTPTARCKRLIKKFFNHNDKNLKAALF